MVTKFYIDGEWVELNTLEDKAKKWDEVYDFLKISESDIVVAVLKRGLEDSKRLKDIKNYALRLKNAEYGMYLGDQIRVIGTTLQLKAMGYNDE